MNDRNAAQHVEAARWYAIAERDLAAARHDLQAKPPLVESAAYNCQQACEKFIKGCLVSDGKMFPYSHNLRELASLILPHHPDLGDLLQSLQEITVWGTAYRYPFEEETQPPPTVEAVLLIIDKITELHSRLKASK